ncbi:MAG: HD domain-containing protein [Nanoarchaeota archaeon]|nr:HD domain-containing protein [Nanoarchaeota archaeon]
MKIHVPAKGNTKLEKIMERVNCNIELQSYLKASNVLAVNRLKINDHGPVHVTIVANIALKIFRNLIKFGIKPAIVKDFNEEKFTVHDAEAVVFLASILHDIGHFMGREDHEKNSLFVAKDIVEEVLDGIYEDEQRHIMLAEVLQAMVTHDSDVRALTLEGGVVRISDALDMKEGRARIPFDEGYVSIHSVSAMSIEEVNISASRKYPVEIEIIMTNSAGIFQVDNLLKKKITGSTLEKYIHVIAKVKSGQEEKIVNKWEFN